MYDSPPFVTTGDESSDPEVIQHIKPENRTAKERQILDDLCAVRPKILKRRRPPVTSLAPR
jgi:hypothetical protein